MTQAMPIPPISTTKTPPTFANPSSLAVELDLDVSSYKTGTGKYGGGEEVWNIKKDYTIDY